MNLLLFSALSIKCHECMPNQYDLMKNVSSLPKNLTLEGYRKYLNSFSLCAKPTGVNDCHGSNDEPEMDSCMTSKIVLGLTVPVVNFNVNITMHMMNCTTSFVCSPDILKSTCDQLKDMLKIDGLLQLEDCKMRCCQEDLCNDAGLADKPQPTGTSSRNGGQISAVFTLVAMVLFQGSW